MLTKLTIFFCFVPVLLFSQIRHYKTGEILTNAKADTVYVNKGIFNNFEAEYCILVAPENRQKQKSKLITISVVRIPALQKTDNPPVFLLNGGPGLSNIWEENLPSYLLDSFDIVMVGYRGVDGEVQLNSQRVKDFLIQTDNPFHKDNYKKLNNLWSEEIAKTKNNIDIAGFTVEEICNDLNAVRKHFQYDSINILAYSYGTMISQLYNLKYRNKVNKQIYISTRPYGNNNFNFQDSLIIFKAFDSVLVNKFNIKGKERNSFYHYLQNGLNKIEEIDHDKLQYVILNKFYSIDAYEPIIQSLLKAKNTADYTDLIKIQKEFNTTFDKMYSTDCVLKRYSMNHTNYSNDIKYGFFGNLIHIGNLCWNSAPNGMFIKTNPTTVLNNIQNQPTLFISGKNDFVSPFYLINEYLIPYYTNYTSIEVDNNSHENLLINLNEDLEKIIKDFF